MNHIRSRVNVICVWNLQIVKGLWKFWNELTILFRTEEIGHACLTVDRTYPPKC